MMVSTVDWLPALVLFTDYDGRWERYVEAVYQHFKTDFVNDRAYFRGIRVGIKSHPIDQNKEAGFWHLVSEGRVKSERLPDLRRCERIRWPRAIIEHADNPHVKVWENRRNNDRRICIWCEDAEYLVVLARRRGYVLLWTAYPVTRSHRKRKLLREFEEYTKRQAPPSNEDDAVTPSTHGR